MTNSNSPIWYNRNDSRKRRKERELVGFIISVGEDYLPSKSSKGAYNRLYPSLIVIGRDYYSILMIYLKQQILLAVGDKIDLEEYKSKILLIRRMHAQSWSSELQKSIRDNLMQICQTQEPKFVDWFNQAKPITTKLHQLKLLPGIGPKRMWQIIDARKIAPFSSFKDIEERTGLKKPEEIIVNRILEELETNQKYNLFTKTSG